MVGSTHNILIKFSNSRLCLATGGSLSEACDKSVLPCALSVVLAFFLLELRHDLCEDHLLLPPASSCLDVGRLQEAQTPKSAQRMRKWWPKHV
jgi:hypothetical protein